jgi:hypothetical protein
MEGAALLLMVSSLGVGFGWQPMPDGSPRYEYIVQVEPELAATLVDGKSIPIVSDIPEEIQPVGRVRLVVGSGDLPRQRLVTRLKPADAGAGAVSSGVALAQYNRYNDERYATAPNQGPAPSVSVAAAEDSQGGAEWNSGGADAPITPTGSAPQTARPLAGDRPPAPSGEAPWNRDDASAPAVAANGPLAKVGDRIQEATEPVRQGLEKMDDRVRSAAEKFGSRTQELVGELTNPGAARQGQRLPAGANLSAPEWNANAPGAAPSNPLRTGEPGAANAWNSQPPGSSTETAVPSGAPAWQARAAAAPQADSQSAAEWNNSATDASSTAGSAANGSSTAPPFASSQGADPWAAAEDPRPGAASAKSTLPPDMANMTSRPGTVFGGAGSNWPAGGPQPPELGAPTNAPPFAKGSTAAGAAAQSPPPLNTPSIDRNMLAAPAARPLDGATTSATTALGSAAAPLSSTSATGTTNPFMQPAATLPNSQQAGVKQPASPAVTSTAAAGGRDHTVIALVAWVLLSGSAAGNLYLFWSFLDVRQKYRAMVRKTARAVGNRFSTA